MNRVFTIIGLMSGTSLDGIDAALIRTDGENQVERLGFVTIPYDEEMRNMIRRCLGRTEDTDGLVARTENDVTRAHAAAVDWLLSKTGMQPGDIDLIGFHGQTIHHDPASGFTWQIGNGPLLARLTGIDVVNDFRSADVAAGGQGAPLIPLYHAALAAGVERPVAVLNIGGVANITYLDKNGEISAFDTGPGNALLDDWVRKHTGRDCDENGLLARQGTVDERALETLLAHGFFNRKPPKSLDRDAWDLSVLQSLSPADGAATLTAFTVRAIARAIEHLPQPPQAWYVAGGGRHNLFMMESLKKTRNVPVLPVEDLGWNGDALEAEGFGWLAVRSVRGLPLSLPATTGTRTPVTGGVLHKPDAAGFVGKLAAFP